MDHPITAIYDANVLYPAPIRDLFLRIVQSGLVFARWTESLLLCFQAAKGEFTPTTLHGRGTLRGI